MQSLITFIRISDPIPEFKKYVLTIDRENITQRKESEQSELLANKSGYTQMQLRNLGGVTILGKFFNFTLI